MQTCRPRAASARIFLERTDRIDLPLQKFLDRMDSPHQINESHVSEHQQINVAAGHFCATCHRTEDPGHGNSRTQRCERGSQSRHNSMGLAEYGCQLFEQMAAPKVQHPRSKSPGVR